MLIVASVVIADLPFLMGEPANTSPAGGGRGGPWEPLKVIPVGRRHVVLITGDPDVATDARYLSFVEALQCEENRSAVGSRSPAFLRCPAVSRPMRGCGTGCREVRSRIFS